MNNSVIALVPMKGHSERVPNKNLRVFGEKPLYHYIINALLKCSYVQGVYINTDSKAIAGDVVANFPSKVFIINRPSSICGDFVSMDEIIRHDLSQIDGKYFLQTHSTNPLLKTETLNKAIKTFFELDSYDSLFSVTKIKSRLYFESGQAINHDPQEMIRTQDLPIVYEENSNFYLFSRDSFGKQNRRVGVKPYMYPISKLESVDIDTEEDFKLAETLYGAQLWQNH